MREECPEDGH